MQQKYCRLFHLGWFGVNWKGKCGRKYNQNTILIIDEILWLIVNSMTDPQQ